MKTKNNYIAPATEVVDMEVQLMTGVSGDAFKETGKSLNWDNGQTPSSVYADEGW